MPTPTFNLRITASLSEDLGAEPVIAIDTAVLMPLGLGLGGFPGWRHQRVQVPAAAVDQAITFTDAVLLLVFSDQPISIKTKTGETAALNQVFHGWCAKDATHAVSPAAGILVSNPGASVANVDVLVIEKGT